MSVANNIKSTLPKTETAKQFMNFMEEHSQTADKSLAGTLMEHVIEMTNITTKLKSLGMNVDNNFLVQFIINSLPSEYSLFQMKYNTMKDKWNVNELHNMLVQEETRLKNQRTHSIHLAKQGPLKMNESSIQVHKKEHKNYKCRFCGKLGHFQKDCL
ncbi:hypothetical protein ACOSQ2_021917 [Xanthoceras sorbifolium]